jgi:DNA ligase D-like protein (predicted 3'-phosphoesterase)
MPKKSLAAYRKKRKFSATKEPQGRTTKIKTASLFVVQKHDASHLHYDFRFSYKGVLKSWAVPKGISSKLGERHLAVPTEDHPLDYAYFEGVIPEGNYGAGPVMVWDIGTYINIKRVDGKLIPLSRCLKEGHVELWLEGSKLKGGYALIRTTRAKTGGEYWLLLKMKDKLANKPFKNSTKSALSGRTLKQIASQP